MTIELPGIEGELIGRRHIERVALPVPGDLRGEQ